MECVVFHAAELFGHDAHLFLTEPRRSPARRRSPAPGGRLGGTRGLELSPWSVFPHECCRYPKDSARYKVANCIQAQPVFSGFARLAHGKVIFVSVLSDSSGAWNVFVEGIAKAFARTFESVRASASGCARQTDAGAQSISRDRVVSTDPPYYDNIGYADLSDFFYVWLRHALKPALSDLFATLRTLTKITLPCAKRAKPEKTGCAWMQLATLYRALS